MYPSVAAIILQYWPERIKNVQRIVQDLQEGSLPPDKIIVWNNNRQIDVFPASVPGAVTINSWQNFHCLVRHAIGLVAETDACLFIDDDLTVGEDTLKRIVEYHAKGPTKMLLGYIGKFLNRRSKDTPYTDGEYIKPPKAARFADVVLGRLHFCGMKRLARSFLALSELPELWMDGIVEEDILLSLSGSYNVILPDLGVVELSDGGVGYHHTEGHYPRRNKSCRILLDNLSSLS